MRQPLDRAGGVERDGNEIDPPDRGFELLMIGQKPLGCRQDSAPLGRRDPLFGPPCLLTVPRLDLDEDDYVGITHHKIEFTGAAPPIGGDELHTFAFEESSCDRFAAPAESRSWRRRHRSIHADSRPTGANERRCK